MRKQLSFFLSAFVSAIALGAGTDSTQITQPARTLPPRNVILVGWDGAQREHVRECLQRGELSALKALASEGSLRNIDVRGTTDTKAGWSQILTGYDPDVTGVYSNSRFQPVPRGLSVFERLKERFGPAFVTVAVIAKEQHCGEIRPPSKEPVTDAPANAASSQGTNGNKTGANNHFVPEHGKPDAGTKIIEENGVKYRVFPGSPYYYTKDACNQWISGLIKDEAVGAKTIELLEQYRDKPFFFFVHFAKADQNGHAFGENSKEYNDALISNDAWTGRIVQKLKDLGLYDKTLIYVTADHGFDEGKSSHKNAPRVFLAANDPTVKRNGDRADITPTILKRFGVDVTKLRPPLAGAPLDGPAKSSSRARPSKS